MFPRASSTVTARSFSGNRVLWESPEGIFELSNLVCIVSAVGILFSEPLAREHKSFPSQYEWHLPRRSKDLFLIAGFIGTTKSGAMIPSCWVSDEGQSN